MPGFDFEKMSKQELIEHLKGSHSYCKCIAIPSVEGNFKVGNYYLIEEDPDALDVCINDENGDRVSMSYSDSGLCFR